MKHALLSFDRTWGGVLGGGIEIPPAYSDPPPPPVYLILPDVEIPLPLLAPPVYSGPVTTECYFIKSP